MKLLLLEDDLVDQMAFQRWMSKELNPCHLAIAGSIEEGKAIVEENDFDFIICDFFLPDGNIFDFINDVNPAQVVCITGGNDPERIKEIKESGISNFFFKDNQLNYLNDFKEFILKTHELPTPSVEKKVSKKIPSGQLIQLKHLKRAFDNNPEPIKEVIQIFLEQTPPQLEALRKAVANKNKNTCYSISHRLKSSFRMMGLFQQMERLEEIEEMCCKEIYNHLYFTNMVEKIQKDSTVAFHSLRNELETL